MAGRLDLPFSVFTASNEEVDAKYRVADDTARDLLITNNQVRVGYVIFHVADDKRYILKALPTEGSTIGVVWEEIQSGGPSTSDHGDLSGLADDDHLQYHNDARALTWLESTQLQADVALNTAKVTDLVHPLVETAVPVGALFTDTVYDDTTIQSEVDLNTDKVGITPTQAANIVTNNDKISFDSASSARLANTSGTNTGDQDLSSFVPYIGANQDVELGDNKLSIGDVNPITNPTLYDMAVNINVDTSKISGLDFQNDNSAGQVRLLARNDEDSYVVLNSYGSTASGTIMGEARTNATAVFSNSEANVSQALVVGTYNAGDLVFGTRNIRRLTISKDGDAVFESTVEADSFIKDGGTSDDVLLGDGTTTSLSAIGGGGTSPLTTKGDLYIFDTINNRLGVGTDNQVLTADSSTSSGLKWADATGGQDLSDYVPYIGATTDLDLGSNDLKSGYLNVITTQGRIATFGTVGASTATATPMNVSFGSTYGNSAAGSVENLKWDLYTSSSSGSRYGIGMSSGLMEFQAGATGGFGYFVNGGDYALKLASTKEATFYGAITATNLSGTNTGDQDLSSLAHRNEDNTFTGDNEFTEPLVITSSTTDCFTINNTEPTQYALQRFNASGNENKVYFIAYGESHTLSGKFAIKSVNLTTGSIGFFTGNNQERLQIQPDGDIWLQNNLIVSDSITLGGTVDGVNVGVTVPSNTARIVTLENAVPDIPDLSDYLLNTTDTFTGSLDIVGDLTVTTAVSGEIANFTTTNGSADITMRYGYAGYGWVWTYEGSGAGTNNKHILSSEGAGGTAVQAYEITQDGKMTFGEDATFSKTIVASNLSGTNTGDQDLTNYVTLDGNETITGTKIFGQGITVGTGLPNVNYGTGSITSNNVAGGISLINFPSTANVLTIDFPNTSGTLALLSDITSGSGDMTKAVYDPYLVGGDAFDMSNMEEGTTSKILTSTERTNISANTSFIAALDLAGYAPINAPTFTGGSVIVDGGNGPSNLLIIADGDNSTETDTATLSLSQDGGLITGSLGFDSTNNLVLDNNGSAGAWGVGLALSGVIKLQIDGSGNTIASGSISATNLSGTNTGDQDLSNYVTLNGTQTITGTKTFSNGLVVNGEINCTGGDGYIINGKGWALDDGTVLRLGDWDSEDYDLVLYSFGTEMMRITEGGVGIGVTTPTQALDVVGNGKFSGSLTATSLYVSGDSWLGETKLGGEISAGSSAKLQVNGFQRTGTIYLHPGGHTPTNDTEVQVSNVSTLFNVNKGGVFSGSLTATSFLESSLRELKTNIKPFEKSGLDIINSLDIVEYNKKDNLEVDKIGIIIDDSPEEVANEDQTAVDLYKTIFVQAKAIQELTERLEKLEKLLG